MPNNAFLNFLFLSIFKHKSKHISIFLISILLVFVLSSVLFLASSIKHTTLNTLEAQPDFIVQKIVAGQSVPIENSRAERYGELAGVSYAKPRVFGRYLTPDGRNYTIIGIDFFEETLDARLTSVIEHLDVKALLQKPSMIVGNGVKAHMASNYFDDYFHFNTPKGTQLKVSIFDTFDTKSNLFTNDTIIMPIELARDILGIEQDLASDIILNVPNDAERDNVKFKLESSDFDTRVISKPQLQKAYENLFNYKGGVFLTLYLLSLITFMLILYERYTLVQSSDKKEIGILRAIGWSIQDILKLKLLETIIIGIWAFLIGIILAYGYLFFFDAPLLAEIFIGFGNLENHITLSPFVSFGTIITLFLFFIIPFSISVLIPVWKIAVTDPTEVMK